MTDKDPDDRVADPEFPHFASFPTGVIYDFLPVPKAPAPPEEYVYLPAPKGSLREEENARYRLAIQNWNLAWEVGSLRPEFFSRELPDALKWLLKFRGQNICLIPFGESHKYSAYSPLYHLLSARTLERFGLPVIRKGAWPLGFSSWYTTGFPRDVDQRLGRAFAHHVWPLLCSGSPLSAFTERESIRMLAHNLDFWFPYANQLVRERVCQFGRPRIREERQRKRLAKLRTKVPKTITPRMPLYGGDLWRGETAAWEFTRDIVEAADRGGRLRAILEAVRSHRVQDDFSGRWSRAKEDFERKLYRKRAKIKVTFVELTDTIAVHGPQSEVDAELLWEDFFALLNEKERRVVVCLRSGTTRVGEVAVMLGYANHSPVSKALTAIRVKAARLLGLDRHLGT